ncbi:chlorohydrolase [Streptococcus pneumoniae]|nr:chlorohydrolase [Streptococcus pneumoniae]
MRSYKIKLNENQRANGFSKQKLAAGYSKRRFEGVDETDEVSNHIYGKATLTKFELDFRRV